MIGCSRCAFGGKEQVVSCFFESFDISIYRGIPTQHIQPRVESRGESLATGSSEAMHFASSSIDLPCDGDNAE